MSPHNIGFYEDLTKIIFELSSNTHLIFLLLFVVRCLDSITSFVSIFKIQDISSNKRASAVDYST